jgi:hypothetical protein
MRTCSVVLLLDIRAFSSAVHAPGRTAIGAGALYGIALQGDAVSVSPLALNPLLCVIRLRERQNVATLIGHVSVAPLIPDASQPVNTVLTISADAEM